MSSTDPVGVNARYEIDELKKKAVAAGHAGKGSNGNEGPTGDRGAHWMFSKYQVERNTAHACDSIAL